MRRDGCSHMCACGLMLLYSQCHQSVPSRVQNLVTFFLPFPLCRIILLVPPHLLPLLLRLLLIHVALFFLWYSMLSKAHWDFLLYFRFMALSYQDPWYFPITLIPERYDTVPWPAALTSVASSLFHISRTPSFTLSPKRHVVLPDHSIGF